MKKIISDVPLKVSLISILAMVSIIVLFFYSIHVIKIKDVIYSGAFNEIRIDEIVPNNRLQVCFEEKCKEMKNLAELKKYIRKNMEHTNTICTIYVERKLADYFFM